MGLDTTHGCWHGPYSSFMRWREALHFVLAEGPDAAKKSLRDAWAHGDYADQSVPINVLMNHSDCDGEIAAKDCGPLADALEHLLPHLPEDETDYDDASRTRRFISGLREAAANDEAVEFR